jgi:hypothetical protein
MGFELSREKIIFNEHLICHDGYVCNAVQSLQVKVESESQGDLELSYELTGDLAQIRIPEQKPPAAADGLWEHTCFEVFVAVEGEADYHEFNFSTSGQWAAYAFSGYRVRSAWTASRSPSIRFVWTNEHLQLEALIAAADLPRNNTGKPLQLALAAVIEANDGTCSYWALHHPEARPDFHHRAGFILSLNQT